MEQKNYTCSIIVKTNATETMKAISHINEWWVKNFDGKAEKLNDEFVINWGEPFVNFKITEFDKDKKVVWTVTDCFLPWLNNKTEWNNTKVVFNLSGKNRLTNIDFTHIGLVPKLECYEMCVKGWNQFVVGSLTNLLNEGVGQPS